MFKRKDGSLVKDLDSIHKIMPHLMNNRCDAEVYLEEKFDITELLKFIDELNKDLEKNEQYTLFIAIITTILKTIHNRPHLNRFISGRRLYQRTNLSASFVIKKEFEDFSDEAIYIYKANDNDNIHVIKNNIKKEVKTIRESKLTSIDKVINLITSGPRFITMFIVKIVKILDFYGLVPNDISKDDPNFTSVMLTNLGSIKCNNVYHHLNNYGTNSLFISVGTIYKEGNKSYVNMGFTVDERIADGFYFAKSILLAKDILNNPKLLEEDISKIIKE